MIREQKIKSSMAAPSVMLFPVKDGFVGRGTRFKDKEYYQTINLFDKELNKQKELNSLLVATRGGGKINILSRSLAYQSYKDKIYISGKRGLSIDVLDSSGKKMSTISKADYQPRKFTSEDEATMRREMKKGNPRQYEAIKKRLVFPEYYPDILNMFFANDKLYVATWKWKQDKIEFFVFSPEGKLLKHRYIPFKFMDGLQPYPAAIMNDKLYQLIENEDTEEWELHINPIQ